MYRNIAIGRLLSSLYGLKKFLRPCLVVLVIGLSLFSVQGQSLQPMLISEKVPEEFWTREHLFYINGDTIRKSLQEYRGKLLILDFWSSNCGACIYQMKNKQQFKETLKDLVTLIPVNPPRTKDTYQSIVNIHNKHFKDKGDQGFSTIFQSDYLSALFPTYAYPMYVWISQLGNVLAYSSTISENIVSELIKVHQLPKKD